MARHVCMGATLALLGALASGGEVAKMTDTLHWLGHDGFRIDGPPVVYLDPFQLHDGLPPADLILITHAHYDHLSPADIAKVRTPKTVVVGPKEVADALKGVTVIAAGETRTFAGVTVRALPAYNTNKSFHTRASGKLGYLVTVTGVTYYHAGDTDLIPEMAGLKPDVALLPVSGTYVMTAAEAAEAARAIKPAVAVPMHYGTIVGSAADAARFAALLKGSGIEVIVKRKE
jgi:L-ascorbate metabolism protein UlaG (beta-lactamase superfamily)